MSPSGGSENIVKGLAYIVEYAHENFKILKYREKFQISCERPENVSILFLHYELIYIYIYIYIYKLFKTIFSLH